MQNRFYPIITLSVIFFAFALALTVYAGIPLQSAIIWNVLSSLDVIYYTLPVSYASNAMIFAASVLDVFVFVLTAVWLAGFVFGFVKDIDLKGKIVADKIKKLHGHVIVDPYNAFAMEVIRELREKKIGFVVVTEKEKIAEQLIREGLLAIVKEPDSVDTFYDAGINNAKSVVVCSDSDFQNIMISIAAKSANKKIHLISRLGDQSNTGHMEMVGVYKTVSPEDAAGKQIAEELVKKIV